MVIFQLGLRQYPGNLPIRIKAVPEGTVVPIGKVLATIENTDSNCAWLTTFVETALLRAIWYPSAVASNAYHSKKIILQYLEETGTPEAIDFKLHDFGAKILEKTLSQIVEKEV